MQMYEIDYDALKGLQVAMERAPAVTMRELEAAVTEADVLLQREVIDGEAMQKAKASGLLAQSIFHTEEVSQNRVLGLVSTPLAYALPVEIGTKPHFPPLEPLIDWVKVKLNISGEKEARGVAFLIARKISRQGTKGQRPFGQAFDANQEQVAAIFARAGERIAAAIPGGAAA